MPKAKKNFTFICGSDDFLAGRAAKEVYAEKTADVTDDFGKEIVNGDAHVVADVERAVQQFCAAVQTLPMFGDSKVVWFKDVNFLGDTTLGKTEGTLAQVEILKDTLVSCTGGDEVKVLISAFPVDRRRSFTKWCEKQSDFQFIGDSKNSAAAAEQLIEEECKSLGVTIEPGAVEMLIAKVNANTRLIIQEVLKLATYLGDGGEITESMINDLVGHFGEGDFFEVAEAFSALDIEWALAAVRRHFFTNNDSRGLLSTLQGRNRLMIQIRILLDAGALNIGYRGISAADLKAAEKSFGHFFDADEAKSNYNVFTQSPWYLGKLAQNVSKVPLKRLIFFQKEFVRAFEGIIQFPQDQEKVIRELVLRCLSA